MDFALIVRAAELLARFIPTPSPPRFNYDALIESLPSPDRLTLLNPGSAEIESPQNIETVGAAISITPKTEEVGTSCMACSRSHLTLVSGALDEGLRFARAEGIMSPEVMTRIDAAERDINIMERIDLSPDKVSNSGQEEREILGILIPRIRKLRQDIGQIKSVPDLEKAAGDAITLSQDFKTSLMKIEGVGEAEMETPVETESVPEPEPAPDEVKRIETKLMEMQRNGHDLNPIIRLAHQVQEGKISVEEARAKARELLPELR